MSDSNLVTISLRFDSVELKAFQRMYAGATLKTRPCLMLLVQCCARQEMLVWALFKPRRPLLLTLNHTYLSTVKGSVPSRPVPHLRGARDSPSTWKLRSATPRQMRVCSAGFRTCTRSSVSRRWSRRHCCSRGQIVWQSHKGGGRSPVTSLYLVGHGLSTDTSS